MIAWVVLEKKTWLGLLDKLRTQYYHDMMAWVVYIPTVQGWLAVIPIV